MWLTKAHTFQEAPTSTSGSSSPQISYQIPVMNGATRAMQYSS